MTIKQSILDDIDNIKQSIIMRVADNDISSKYAKYVIGRLDELTYKVNKNIKI